MGSMLNPLSHNDLATDKCLDPASLVLFGHASIPLSRSWPRLHFLGHAHLLDPTFVGRIGLYLLGGILSLKSCLIELATPPPSKSRWGPPAYSEML